MRNWERDEPVLDAEESGEDTRPLVGHCVICGCELRGSTAGYDPDDGYEIDNVFICADHLHEYFKDRRIR
jgi:hypothetical protein